MNLEKMIRYRVVFNKFEEKNNNEKEEEKDKQTNQFIESTFSNVKFVVAKKKTTTAETLKIIRDLFFISILRWS